MNASDPDRSWYASNEKTGETLGPFSTLEEVREYLARLESIDEWRGSVCQALRGLGHPDLADEFGGVSNPQVMTYRDTHAIVLDAAAFLAREREKA